MFITLEISDGSQATINVNNVTHITQYENEYPEAGSVIHFTSDRLLQVKAPVAELCRLIEVPSLQPAAQLGLGHFILSPTQGT